MDTASIDAMVSVLTFKVGKVETKNQLRSRRYTVDASICDTLAVHKKLTDQSVFVVTHVKSGLSLGFSGTRQNCRRMVALLLRMGNVWDFVHGADFFKAAGFRSPMIVNVIQTAMVGEWTRAVDLTRAIPGNTLDAAGE